MNILIAVLTYRREPQLRDCLLSVQASARSSGSDFAIVVGDNDPTSVSKEAYVAEATRLHLGLGLVSAGRQALLDYARSNQFDYLAFIDDDEIVSTSWLKYMLTASSDYDCSAVAGPVSPTGLPASLEPLYGRARRRTGEVVSSAGAGNLLIDLRRVRETNFNPEWPLSGGEDTDFTLRLGVNEGPIIWCNEADVYEPVSSDRLSRRWLIRRYFNNGRILRCATHGLNPTMADTTAPARFGAAFLCLVLFPASLLSAKLMRLILDQGARNLGYLYQMLKKDAP